MKKLKFTLLVLLFVAGACIKDKAVYTDIQFAAKFNARIPATGARSFHRYQLPMNSVPSEADSILSKLSADQHLTNAWVDSLVFQVVTADKYWDNDVDYLYATTLDSTLAFVPGGYSINYHTKRHTFSLMPISEYPVSYSSLMANRENMVVNVRIYGERANPIYFNINAYINGEAVVYE
ncbi:hypothetical protein GC194_08850 [bacterium]|nr:hypothetical protein [bacterium]